MTNETKNWIPERCIVFGASNGVGNILNDTVNAVVHSSVMGEKTCFVVWWNKIRMRRLHGGLQDLIDFGPINRFGTSVSPLSPDQLKELSLFAGSDYIVSHKSRRAFVILNGIRMPVETKISTSAYPPELVKEVWRSMTPAKGVLDLIDSMSNHLVPRGTIGVHVRRTDHIRASGKSTTEKFFERIDAMLGKNHDRIFLATDNEDTEMEFSRRYGNLVGFSEKSTPKRWAKLSCRRGFVTMDTYKEGLVDIMLLGKCDVVLGSFGSSFSKASARMSRIKSELHVIF